MAVTIIRAEHNKELFDLLLTLDRKNKSEMKYWAGLHGFTGTSEGGTTICSASTISSEYRLGKHVVLALDMEPVNDIVLLGDYTGLGFTGTGTWFVLSCQEIGGKELVLVCTDQP